VTDPVTVGKKFCANTPPRPAGNGNTAGQKAFVGLTVAPAN